MNRSESNVSENSKKESALMAELVQNSVNQDLEKDKYIFMKAEKTVQGIPTVQTKRQHPSVNSKIKRMIDIVGSVSGLVILSPVMGLITALIKLDSPGPAVFKQKRAGLNGKMFYVFKFRSMYYNTSSKTHETYIKELIHGEPRPHNEPKKNKKVFKLADDDRVTKIGRIIRRTSLDELPQLVNVLRSEMSLVGPRPAISYEVNMYKDWYKRRLSIRPGITGLWQVGGRSERTFDEMIELDLEYADNWSLFLDLKVLWQTIFVVIKRDGAW